MLVREHSQSDDLRGFFQVLMTFGALALLWWGAAASLRVSIWLTAAIIPLISLFTLRVFALMHDCGHGSLFRSTGLNRAFGFALGVVAGMPQYVWSRNHAYHHVHNGNWDAYRGPYTTLSVDEYAALTLTQQRLYRVKCSMACAPIAGFIYLIFNPRYTWMRGSLELLWQVARGKLAQPRVPLRELAAAHLPRYCKSWKEYRHMSFNNIVLLSVWVVMCSVMGTAAFFGVYLISLSLAGAAGIVLFTVQHNFPGSHASDAPRWDHDAAAISGTSFLVLPRWLNFFTASIGYHHVHHLSSRIPNYCLIRCHDQYQHLFKDVTRVKLPQVSAALKCILWDTRAQQIISVADYREQLLQASCA
jgi:omega-6 fatty acid desaturase (delta-12 desaturase)